MATKKAPRRSARERILEAASELFYQEGTQNVGIDRVIAESGVAKMSLYNNFKSKDDLIAACLEKQGAEWSDFLKKKLDAMEVAPTEKLLAIFDILLAWATKPNFRGCAFINCSVELANPDHPAFQIAVRHKEMTVTCLRDLATRAHLPNPEAIAQQLMILAEGSIVMAMMQGKPDPMKQAKQAARTLIEANREWG
ncbi:TetR/AcrR family transcriptional regulator [[Limnothrix rosea] IAM M-220]|uniref:TetR/AcrR family transcriptional regulator n=1 Tax=[Limnothrix rosea] IAM M-220 TaxID=454133 RepID=UPI0009693139|nr:TetR/AcrR family transcriptional regulator [[Limnothrix rosea] IAM M-220]OKH11411.1 TetR family transcriptional regulator [[Limnothrix rosea] IAM M-220]